MENNRQFLYNHKDYPFWKITFSTVGVLLVSYLTIIIFSFILNSVVRKIGYRIDIKSIVTFLSMFTMPCAIIVGLLWFEKHPIPNYKLRFSLKAKDILLILFSVGVILCFGIVSEPLQNLLPEKFQKMLDSINVDAGGLMMFSIVIWAPFFEEVFLRGILQGSAVYRYGAVRGILLASFLFGIIHFIPQQVVHATFVGIILGYAYYKTGSLLPPILIHLLQNTIALIGSRYSEDDGLNKTLREEFNNDVGYFLLYAFLFLVVSYVLYRMYKSTTKIERERNNCCEVSVE